MERPVVPPTDSASKPPDSGNTDNTGSETINVDIGVIDPIDTHCSDELRLAQDTDKDITQNERVPKN